MHETEHFPFILFLVFVFHFPLVILLVPAIQYLPWPSFPPRPCARVDSSFKPMPGIEDPFLSGFCHPTVILTTLRPCISSQAPTPSVLSTGWCDCREQVMMPPSLFYFPSLSYLFPQSELENSRQWLLTNPALPFPIRDPMIRAKIHRLHSSVSLPTFGDWIWVYVYGARRVPSIFIAAPG
jgi:hypothetical protein